MFGKEDHGLSEHAAGAKVSRFLAQGPFRYMQAEIGQPRNCHFRRHCPVENVVRGFHRAHFLQPLDQAFRSAHDCSSSPFDSAARPRSGPE